METKQTPIALITGGSRGLGRNAALALAAQGTDVILTYRSNLAEAESVVAQIRALGRRAATLALDTGNTEGFANFADRLRAVLADEWQRERFDFLVNNAGIGVHQNFAETTEAQFDALMNVHLKGVFFLTQKLLPLIQDGGRILNVSSGLARFALPGYAAYAAMKGGGAVRDNAQLNAFIAAQTALGRVGQPDDIGGAIAALLSPGGRWINAQRIEASGGMFL